MVEGCFFCVREHVPSKIIKIDLNTNFDEFFLKPILGAKIGC